MRVSLERIFEKNISRWIIFLIDILISLTAVIAAYLLRFNFEIETLDNNLSIKNIVSYVIPFVLIVRAVSFIIGGTYTGLIRYTSAKDSGRIFAVVSLGTLLFIIVNIINHYLFNRGFFIPFSVLIIEYIALVFIMTISRILVKVFYYQYLSHSKIRENVVIYGSEVSGIMAKHALDSSSEVTSNVIGFIDHNNKKTGSKMEGVRVYGTKNIEKIFERYNINKLIIAEKEIGIEQKTKIVDLCLDYNINVSEIPKFESWITGKLSAKQIKSIKIEDLLERELIELNWSEIKNQILDKVILVTGAAGSIGSEIVRQIIRFNPKKIILFDQAESPLYDIELSLKEEHLFSDFKIIIGDIQDKPLLEKLFKTYKPQLVYHAAAYKHVPMMENNPAEAIKTNVFGTKNVADLAAEFQCEHFVMVSTDKAVNPTNVMGASKRIAEIYIQSLNQLDGSTHYVTTRFGNVLGSAGSVIPRFKEQIDKGGPITVTHPEITRYFMTIPEACQLVLQAAAIGKEGNIFIFDMGKSVKIVDLAKKMIKLSGLKPGYDIHINFTGLREGEKLYEELLKVEENTIPTKYPKIMIAKVEQSDREEVVSKIDIFHKILEKGDNFEIVKHMKKIVPEFKSENSIYA